MASVQILLSLLILGISGVGAVFSFLIWRSNTTRSLYDQEDQIREELLDKEITISFHSDGEFFQLIMRIHEINCYEPNSNWRYKIRRAVWGSNGTTEIQLEVVWSDWIKDMMELHAMSLPNELEDTGKMEELNIELLPGGYSSQRMKIYTTHPKDVNREISKFKRTVTRAVHSKIDELES
ncbi:hypothetical protein [Halorubrum distributum]|uniref:hypothetical protein n=1 Tax=Halorubrum distributum TaxID=29283 RepID=UPI0012674533|nr:hypothetical protein [Halorubrum litoreum]